MARNLRNLTFVTGNAGKLREVKQLLKLDNLVNVKLDLPELQGEPIDIIMEKTRLASREVKGPVLVEDTSLCFNALKGLPGPYIKWFLDKLGHDGLNDLIGAHEDKTAYAQCMFGFAMGPDSEPLVFQGQCDGKIVLPRGPTNFGWDPVFEPAAQENKDAPLTFAEMTAEAKGKISHRSKALAKLSAYLNDNMKQFEIPSNEE